MRVLQIGNHLPPHSTENHLKRALEHNGHTVVPVQENDPYAWSTASEAVRSSSIDFVLWTRTGWDWRTIFAGGMLEALALQHRFLHAARRANVPVIGYHLDIWWGLKREHEIFEEPFFQVDLLVTADGGHDDRWADAGINHVWFPPGVSLAETELGTPRDEFRSEIAFVGSWQGGYHPESEHRFQLVAWLQQNFGNRCKFWPRHHEPAIRGEALRDLYASVDVVVGDSCFSGTDLTRYWSDRVPETVGRGALLFHPWVEGIDDGNAHVDSYDVTWADEVWLDPEGHFVVWGAGKWDELGAGIEAVLANPRQFDEIRMHGRDWVRNHCTYERRMEQLVSLLYERKLLRRPRSKAAK